MKYEFVLAIFLLVCAFLGAVFGIVDTDILSVVILTILGFLTGKRYEFLRGRNGKNGS